VCSGPHLSCVDWLLIGTASSAPCHPAAASPPSPSPHPSCLQVLQLANYLKRQGCFVVVALTRPFDFEGLRKLEQADALIEALQVRSSAGVVAFRAVLAQGASGKVQVLSAC
jgi:hypothetical protein